MDCIFQRQGINYQCDGCKYRVIKLPDVVYDTTKIELLNTTQDIQPTAPELLLIDYDGKIVDTNNKVLYEWIRATKANYPNILMMISPTIHIAYDFAKKLQAHYEAKINSQISPFVIIGASPFMVETTYPIGFHYDESTNTIQMYQSANPNFILLLPNTDTVNTQEYNTLTVNCGKKLPYTQIQFVQLAYSRDNIIWIPICYRENILTKDKYYNSTIFNYTITAILDYFNASDSGLMKDITHILQYMRSIKQTSIQRQLETLVNIQRFIKEHIKTLSLLASNTHTETKEFQNITNAIQNMVDSINYNPSQNLLSFITKPVYIQKKKLGRYIVHVRFGTNNAITIFRADKQVPIHPHVGASGTPCLGGFGPYIQSALQNFDIVWTISLIWNFLHSYEAYNAYARLEQIPKPRDEQSTLERENVSLFFTYG